ncbi:MAG: CSLREA domain-containing protein [Caldilineales bacterium]
MQTLTGRLHRVFLQALLVPLLLNGPAASLQHAAGGAAQAPLAATFTVNTTDDNDDGVCNAAHCSLREAINAANAAPGTDTIAFNIPGSGVRKILPASPLPLITGPVTLDGLTQPGASCASWPPTLRIELQGINAGGVFDIGLNLATTESTVRGLVVNGWTGGGISLLGSGNTVECSFIGADSSGTLAIPNYIGVSIVHASENIIGGGTEAGNLISGNISDGIRLVGVAASDNTIAGNVIGASVVNAALPNGGRGVLVSEGSGNQIGGAGAGDGNTLAFNAGAGVAILDGTGNQIQSNAIHDNGGLGIDLGGDGVTPNDPGDPDPGANLLQNYPTLTGATVAGGTYAAGTINTTPGSSISVAVFGNATCDASGYGEGGSLIGTVNVTTAASGDGTFSTTFPVAPSGRWLATTATDPAGNTSEFGPCRALDCYLDYNHNGRVDVQDVMQVAARWHNPTLYAPPYDVAAPFGSPIDSLDIGAAAAAWGTACP